MRRAVKISSRLVQGDFDVIGLCEVHEPILRDLLLENENLKRSYPHRIFGLGKYGIYDNGTVLLSKHEIIKVQRFQYNTQTDVYYNRWLPPNDLIFAVINLEGREIAVFLTHLQWGKLSGLPEIRKKQIDELVSIIKNEWSIDLPYIILGDLNFYEESQDLEYLFSKLNNICDWYDSSNQTNNPGYTWAMDNNRTLIHYVNERFDHIISNQHITPKYSKVKKFYENEVDTELDPAQLSPSGRMWYYMTRMLQILIFPHYLVLRGLDWLIKYSKGMIRDELPVLSDHYALYGEAVLK